MLLLKNNTHYQLIRHAFNASMSLTSTDKSLITSILKALNSAVIYMAVSIHVFIA